ncbi:MULTISPECIES: hypothetical protein [unclassified Lysobacter]|uniref:hypothetical protein n=1 Tax=unclassified Lysobacter TaxID=2635362 RepID=UPI001BEA2D30|nr:MULTISPECIES: hypothetical protein [unclassified Lysobacter]MBT2748097.1 hypothetical protein [Lysobacter sp. ISL-42]MBT2754137.1 hypothetical protein [Lysobacter sp. ISL-50]MBT2776037.1 hypothetical protein [Lysobacter sp. ISL-54]MBT2784124.1 hypothetical protein [Lysobacter sp. ISL-52]
MKFRALAVLLVLVCCALVGCKTIEPANSMLKDMQEWTTPEPLDRLSPVHEQPRAKAAMVQWVEQYLKHEYRVIGQRFVLTQPGFTAGASIGSKAHQFATQNLGGTMKIEGWYDDDNYRIFLWAFGDSSPRYVAFVWANDFLPDTRERRMVGYLELEPAAKN